MGKQRVYTVPYPANVKAIQRKIRRWIKQELTPGERRRRIDYILAAEYGARRPRYTLIRFLKDHR